jgi:hypothetical protein
MKAKKILLSYAAIIKYLFKLKKVKNNVNLSRGLINQLRSLKINKNSDIVYILGGGCSILEFQNDEWNFIKKQCSFGINNWIIHNHVPDVYIFEMYRKNESNLNFKFIENLKRKAELYSKSIVILKDLDKVYPNFELINKLREIFNLFFIPCMLTFDIFGLEFWKNRLPSNFFWINKFKFDVIFQQRITVSFAIDLARQAGFKKIVLCGVDLNSTKYFWEDPDYIHSLDKNITIEDSQQTGNIHSTVNPLVNTLTADKVIINMAKWYKDNLGIEIYVSSKDSILYPNLPHYSFFK